MRSHLITSALLLAGLCVGQNTGNAPATGNTPSPVGAKLPPNSTPTIPAPTNANAPAPGGAAQDPRAPVRLSRSGQTVLSPRIRNVTKLANSMPYQINGVGLVTGLSNTGASDRGTRQAILNFIQAHGLNLTISDVTGGTTALVSLTCLLPPFAKEGQELDVKVQVLGDATSLRGGQLLRANLTGADNKTYVMAQGSLVVAGFNAGGQNASVKKNNPTVAWLQNGGTVIEELKTSFYSESGHLELQVLNPSPFNATSIAAGIKTALDGTDAKVSPVDTTLVRIALPTEQRTKENAMRILSLIGNVRVAVENPARVLIDQSTGVVLAGEGVLISPCVVGVSDITIAIVEEDFVSQPNPLSDGTTERIGRSRVEAQTNDSELSQVGGGGATVADLLQNLKTLNLQPSQLVSVFQALDHGGFLHAKLEVR